MVMTTTRPREKEQSDSNETKEITFKCRYCGKDKPLDEWWHAGNAKGRYGRGGGLACW